MIRKFIHTQTNQVQLLAVEDICNQKGLAQEMITDKNIAIVYSEPPWGTITEKNWRKLAKVEQNNGGYAKLITQWCDLICQAKGVRHIFCQQSQNEKYRSVFNEAIKNCDGWNFPLIQSWQVYYGTPGRISCATPSILLHFGKNNISSNPQGLTGMIMVMTVFRGLSFQPYEWVFDPCIGIGLTSRVAHIFRLNCIGSELNAERLNHTIKWLLKEGYKEEK